MDNQKDSIRNFQSNSRVDNRSNNCEFVGTAIMKGVDGKDQISAFFGIPSESLDKDGKLVSFNNALAKSVILAIKESGVNPPYFEPALLAIRQREIIIRQTNQGMRPRM